MKFRRLLIALAGLIVIAALIVRSRETYLFEDVSRVVPLGPEGQLSRAQVQKILQQSTEGPVVIAADQNDTSAPLEAIPIIPPVRARPDPDLNIPHPLPNRGGPAMKPAGNFIDPLFLENSALAATLSMAAPVQNFDGLNNVNAVLPPDTNGDVGPNHYMQWVNVSFAIYSKTGTLLYGPAAGNTLWSGFGGPCEATNHGDPIVQYDHLADRWMVSQFALPNYPSGPFYQCIAVSQTANPMGAWYRYAFQISATKLNDYPHFGVWPDGYYMSVNQFVGNTWAGAGAVVFEREKMLLGQPAQAVYFDLYGLDPNLGGMLPSDLDGPVPPAGAPNYFLQIDDDGFGYPQDQIEIWKFSVNWGNPGASTFTQAGLLPTAAFDSDLCAGSRSCIPQPNTNVKLDAIPDRLMYRVQYRNFGSHQTLVLNHTVDVNTSDRAGIRWYELRSSNATWGIHQQGTFSPDNTRRWMGSAAMDSLGNIALGYSASSGTTFPSIRYAGRLAGDPLGQLSQGETTLVAGSGAQTHTSSRWGDYSSLSLDPVDHCTFWYTNEYIQSTGSSSWRTRIGSFQMPGCGSAAPTPTPTNTPLEPTATPTPTGTPAGNALMFSSTADAYVHANNPTKNFGSATTLRADSSPDVHSYLRFEVQGLNGPVSRATLRVFANTASSVGYEIHAVSDNLWNEKTINYNSAPAVGDLIGSSGPISAGAWTTVDVTPYITDNGVFNFGLTTTTKTAFTLGSRETGANAPQLIVETGNGSPPTATPTPTTPAGSTPTSTPTHTPTSTPGSGPASTGFLNPSANAAQTGGDGNGYQTSPSNAYLDDGLFAVDTNSGSGTNSSCTANAKDKHHFYDFGISLPGSTILGIEVRLDAKVDGTSGAPKLCVQLSWDGGSSWTTAKQTPTLTKTEQSYLLGGPADTWGRAWTVAELSNANFRVRVINVATSTARDFSLDWVTVQVMYP
jgi:hypothetical protein